MNDRLAKRLNPDLPHSVVDDVMYVVPNPDHPSLERGRGRLMKNSW